MKSRPIILAAQIITGRAGWTVEFLHGIGSERVVSQERVSTALVPDPAVFTVRVSHLRIGKPHPFNTFRNHSNVQLHKH